MEKIIITNIEYEKKFNLILETYGHLLEPTHLDLIKIVIIRFKKYSDDEYFIILGLIYGLFFFKIINLDNEIISKQDAKNIHLVVESYQFDIN